MVKPVPVEVDDALKLDVIAVFQKHDASREQCLAAMGMIITSIVRTSGSPVAHQRIIIEEFGAELLDYWEENE